MEQQSLAQPISDYTRAKTLVADITENHRPFLASHNHTPARLQDMFEREIQLLPVQDAQRAKIEGILNQFEIKGVITDIQYVARFNDFNSRNFQVTYLLDNGKELKLCLSHKDNWRWTTDQIPNLAEGLHGFSAFLNAAGVPTPAFIRTVHHNASCLDHTQGDGKSTRWVLSYWSDADYHPASPDLADFKAVAATLAKFHQAARRFEEEQPLSTLVGLKGNTKLGVGYNSLVEGSAIDQIGTKLEAIEKALSTEQRNPAIELLGLALKAAKECLTKRDQLLNNYSGADLPPCFIHCDPHPGDWLIKVGENKQKTGILLDLEKVGYGSPYFDMGCVLGDMARCLINTGDSRLNLSRFFNEFQDSYDPHANQLSTRTVLAYTLNHFLNNFAVAANRFLDGYAKKECPGDPNFWQHMLGVFDGLSIAKELGFAVFIGRTSRVET